MQLHPASQKRWTTRHVSEGPRKHGTRRLLAWLPSDMSRSTYMTNLSTTRKREQSSTLIPTHSDPRQRSERVSLDPRGTCTRTAHLVCGMHRKTDPFCGKGLHFRGRAD